MQYVLGFLFGFKFYKNNANVKIYVDDNLLDDLEIDSDIRIEKFEKCSVDYGNKDHIKFDTLSLPKRIFTYTVDESAIKSNLKLVIENDNTNYTNGFMTEYSYFEWYSIFLIPKHFLSKDEYGHARKLFKRYKKMINIGQSIEGKNKGRNFQWPVVEQKVVDRELTIDSNNWFSPTKMGGSYTLEFAIMEHKNIPKFKMLVPTDYKKLHSLDKRSIAVSDYFPIVADKFKLLNMHNEDK